jgi:hypothetical protein
VVDRGEAAVPHTVDIQGPFQVIDLMLQNARIPTFRFDLYELPSSVESPHSYSSSTRHDRHKAGKAETAFEETHFCLVGAVRYKANLSVEDKNGAYSLSTPSGEEHQFTGIVDVARWATANAFG